MRMTMTKKMMTLNLYVSVHSMSDLTFRADHSYQTPMRDSDVFACVHHSSESEATTELVHCFEEVRRSVDTDLIWLCQQY
jgi:hypothetical protein